MNRPAALQERVFTRLFEQAEIARYSEAERRQYEESKKMFWDSYSVLKTAEMKGVLKEKKETVQRMKAKGFSLDDISDVVGLTVDEVKKLF